MTDGMTSEEQALERAAAKLRARRGEAPQEVTAEPEAPEGFTPWTGTPGGKLARLVQKLDDAKRDSMLRLPGFSRLVGYDVYAEMQLVSGSTLIGSGVLPPLGRQFLDYAMRHSEDITRQVREGVGMEDIAADIAAKSGDETSAWTGMLQLGRALAVLSVANIHEATGPEDKLTGKPKLIPNRPPIGLAMDADSPKGIPLDKLPEEDLMLITNTAWGMIERDASVAEPFPGAPDAATAARAGMRLVQNPSGADRPDNI